MAACGCHTTVRTMPDVCPDSKGHEQESARKPRRHGPVFACPLRKVLAPAANISELHEQFVALSQVFNSDADGSRMLVTTKCMSVAQTFASAAHKLLAFMMHKTKRLDKLPGRPDIPSDVWKIMCDQNFMGWLGHDEETVRFD